MKQKKYYVGIDAGTDSVGYAVTDPEYNLCKFKGEAMWGAHIFDAAETCANRRAVRTARRRLDRRQQRIILTQEIFAKEIAKIDEKFFLRLKESGLYREDTTEKKPYAIFNDKGFSDKDYYKKYPTIHHLIMDLIDDPAYHDPRLVYMAVAWLMGHRGHFLSEVDKDHMEGILDFGEVYGNFEEFCQRQFGSELWEMGDDKIIDFQKIIKNEMSSIVKEKQFFELLFADGKKPKAGPEDEVNKAELIKLLSGGKTNSAKLFPQMETEESVELCFKSDPEKLEEELGKMDDEYAEFLMKAHDLYDWGLLAGILRDHPYISSSKIEEYEKHGEDLKKLKQFVKKYLPDHYADIFKNPSKENYVAYSYNIRGVKKGAEVKKASRDAFYDFLKKQLKNVTCQEEDEEFYQDMMTRIEQRSFLPKQVNGDNRVIPYQVYYMELKQMLENASHYLPFLLEKDKDGRTNTDKLLSVFVFRVPYYVGPLNEKSEFAWIQRKPEKIYPWNFEQVVDLEASEQEFIRKLINVCTYYPGEDVLPKNSLLYSKFTVLNEINNIKVNDVPISPEAKQKVYELFRKFQKVTVKRIRDLLIAENYMEKEDFLGGIDVETGIKSNLKSYLDFRRLLENHILTEQQVEQIILKITYTEDKLRIRKWLEKEYSFLKKEDIKYISGLKYKDFGRLSEKFLHGFTAEDRETGELTTIIQTLWNTNDNLNQILFSNAYGFKEELEAIREEYYKVHPRNLETMLDEMYISNGVKRQIYRVLDVVKDVRKAMGCDPARIFVEMARGGGEKGKRTRSRREQIKALYALCPPEEVRALEKELDKRSDNELQSEVLFLYFMQLGKCMYSGEPIDITNLNNDKMYNVDHIYPQSKVKEDSLDNKVLVLSKLNGDKGDSYPVPAAYREKMQGLWKTYRENHLISEEKYKRLIRNTRFTEEEQMGFINRQLVETRQSTKAVASILKEMFPETEIVYVKAGLVSDFRKEFGLLKCRSVNDLHHAKDAYLNVVCGNVYHCRFTQKYFSVREEYSLKTKTLFTQMVKDGDGLAWEGKEMIGKVKSIVEKNNIHYTVFSFKKKHGQNGGFYDQMPLKAAEGLVPRKRGLDPEKYGGYNKTTVSFFMLVRYKLCEKKESTDVMIMPVRLLDADSVLKDSETAKRYAIKNIAEILGKQEELVTEVTFPIGLRPIKINTVFSFDGFCSSISGIANRGNTIILASMMSLIIGKEQEDYIKKLESFTVKKEKNKNLQLDERYDGISEERNKQLYQVFMQKASGKPYYKVFRGYATYLQDGESKFEKLKLQDQVYALMHILELFKTGRGTAVDLTLIGASKASGKYCESSKLSNWKERFHNIQIIDVSSSGIFESRSQNLLEFL